MTEPTLLSGTSPDEWQKLFAVNGNLKIFFKVRFLLGTNTYITSKEDKSGEANNTPYDRSLLTPKERRRIGRKYIRIHGRKGFDLAMCRNRTAHSKD